MTKPIAPENRKRRPKRTLIITWDMIASAVREYGEEKPLTRKATNSVRDAVRHLKDAIGRDPEFGDFTPENLAAVERSMEVRGHRRKNVTNTLSMLKRLWKFCASKGYAKEPPLHCQPPGKPGNPAGHVWNPVNGAGLKVGDAPGTLWHICQREYFPRQIRITAVSTRNHYRYSIRELSELLGRDPTIADLTDDNLAGIVQQMRSKGRAAETINGVTGRLRSLWTWLAKRRIVEQFPTLANVKEPRRVPKAWTREELGALLEACRHCDDAAWWVALHLVIWDTSERIGAVLSIRREWLNWQTGDLLIPAEHRKGQEQDMAYRLHHETLSVLRQIQGGDLLFPHSCCIGTIYHRYKAIRKAAGLATDRKSAFHRMRRSVASHLHAGGFNATDALGHASAEVTRKSYLDPAIAGAVRPADVLFRPGKRDSAVVALSVSAEEARKLPRAKVCAG